MPRGKYIVVDGCEGAGKGTQLKSIRTALPSERVIFTREPGGTPLAEKIRDLLLMDSGKGMHSNTRFGLFASARSDLMQEVIIPALENGIHVISDRDKSSTFAYQVRADGRSELYQLFHHLHAIFCHGATPDLYIYLDVDPEIGSKRTEHRGDRNHFDEKDTEYARVVREGYLEYFRDVSSSQKGTKVKIIDANRSLENVGAEFAEIILEELKS